LKKLNLEYNDSNIGFFNADLGNGYKLNKSVNGVPSFYIPISSNLT
jgi:hypothetical protein